MELQDMKSKSKRKAIKRCCLCKGQFEENEVVEVRSSGINKVLRYYCLKCNKNRKR